MLVDFEYDGDIAEQDHSWRPPLDTNETMDLKDKTAVLDALRQEIAILEPLYTKAKAERGRTTVGISRLSLAVVAEHIVSFLDGPHESSPRADLSAAMALRFCSDDLKAYYLRRHLWVLGGIELFVGFNVFNAGQLHSFQSVLTAPRLDTIFFPLASRQFRESVVPLARPELSNSKHLI